MYSYCSSEGGLGGHISHNLGHKEHQIGEGRARGGAKGGRKLVQFPKSVAVLGGQDK